MVKKMNPGPGGKTLRFGGAVIVKDRLFRESLASMNTRRALEWNACVENPRSMSATVPGANLLVWSMRLALP